MIADKSRRKWGKIGLARLTFRSLARRIDYESATSKSRLHHDLRGSFSQKRMLKRKTKGKQSKNDRMKKGKMVHPKNSVSGLFALFRYSLLSRGNNKNNKYNV